MGRKASGLRPKGYAGAAADISLSKLKGDEITAKKNIKHLGRRALSLLLSLTMVTGMLQIPALAAHDNQLMDGYCIIDESGNQGLAEEGVTSVTEDGFTLSKTIRQPGKDATIVIHYERSVEDLQAAAYTVDYEYRTYTMTLNESGVAGYWSEPESLPEPPVIEIPDIEVPLGELPIVDIPNEEVPLAQVPKTGLEISPIALMSLSSGIGLAYLAITGKKRDDELV